MEVWGEETPGTPFQRCTIKSFKHDGSLHRVWLENWIAPAGLLHPLHRAERMRVCVNDRTAIREADGSEWVSRVPAVSFFIPDEWYNIVALVEESGIRYYCNVASPPYSYDGVITYIDYDLDVVRMPDGAVRELDRDEYVRHRETYRYGPSVVRRIEEGMARLLRRIGEQSAPFDDEEVRRYYEEWKSQSPSKGDEERP